MNRKAYLQELMAIYATIPDHRRPEFSQAFLDVEKNPVVAFGLNTWLGMLGADRFYCGQHLLGALKLLTLGGAGLWIFVDWFLIGGAAREKSIESARNLRAAMLP